MCDFMKNANRAAISCLKLIEPFQKSEVPIHYMLQLWMQTVRMAFSRYAMNNVNFGITFTFFNVGLILSYVDLF